MTTAITDELHYRLDYYERLATNGVAVEYRSFAQRLYLAEQAVAHDQWLSKVELMG